MLVKTLPLKTKRFKNCPGEEVKMQKESTKPVEVYKHYEASGFFVGILTTK